ncbi:c-type cytochrome [Candidatus Electrothrix sp.]|uniref:c-type cytochrome n=2 Tax=Candidatus Electrothrix sp. TaxID=2170559 RepID=UPI004056DE93
MKSCVVALTVASLLVAGSAFASEELLKSNNCMVCHKMAEKAMGPSVADIAKANADTSAEDLAKFIKEGGKSEKYEGIAMPMPPQANVSDEDALAMAEWIKTQAAPAEEEEAPAAAE